MRQEEFRSIDLFCGSGAVTTALIDEGFRVVAAVDNDPVACKTFSANHPNVPLFQNDIRELDPYSIIERDPTAKNIDLLVVCAPCQPFSSQNRKRGVDKRASLLLEAVRFASILEPKCILFENVPGLVSQSNRFIVESLQRGLEELGYYLSRPRKIDAAELGVPQRRIRCVMLAVKSERAAEQFERARFDFPRKTVRETIAHLPKLSSGGNWQADPLHYARAHQAIALERLAAIPVDGGSRVDLPGRLELACHKGRKGFPDVYGRMRWDDVSPTLTTGCTDVTRGRFAHPEQDRAITLREAALLQTFPADYKFLGNHRQIATQIGNAVPVAMVKGLVPLLLMVIKATD
ncbi:putative BsuMI modification methylase subunit YdiO [compost metagenome]